MGVPVCGFFRRGNRSGSRAALEKRRKGEGKQWKIILENIRRSLDLA